MISVSDGFREAVVGVSRRMLGRALVEIVDPDIQYGVSDGSGAAWWSQPEQLRDRVVTAKPRYATLEPGRWVLDGTAELLPETAETVTGQVGHVGDVLSDSDGAFDGTVYAEQPFSNVSILQACSVYFSDDPADGVAEDFRVDIMSGSTAVFSKSYTGNRAVSVSFTDFTVYDPTSIRVYVTRWSLPQRRVRVLDIVPGLYEQWDLSSIVSLDVQMRGNFADLALPYGTANLRLKNTDRRFEPYTRSGIFKSIEERQSIPISLGPVQADGTVEYAPIGVFFQKSGGWTTGQNDMFIDWALVDICGLLAERTFVPPATLPTTLAGWFACFAGQLGENFADWYHVDPDYAELPLTINSAEHLKNRTCGALIRFACMATGTWPRADQETGKLTAEPLWKQGSKVTLSQLYDYPVKSANDTLATLTFKLYDGTEDGTTVVISGNSTSSSKNLSIDNPFLHTAAAAQTAARQILSQYGGIKLEADSRGDPATEIGDVDTIWISRSEAKTGRRMEQSFKISNGVLKQNRNLWLQADGSYLFEAQAVLTGSGTWTPPAGVTEVRYILGQGAQGSTAGENGKVIRYDSGFGPQPSYMANDGAPGKPGRILSGVMNVNAGTPIAYSCGAGTAAGAYGATVAEGADTTFGPNLTTADGQLYENGFTDLASGSAYGRALVPEPKDGTSDGPAAGKGGGNEVWRFVRNETDYDSEGNIIGSHDVYSKVSSRSDGSPGKKGADGFIVLWWDKEAET